MNTPTFRTAAGCAELRSRLKKAMPPEAFQPVPARGVTALVQVAGYLALAAAVVTLPLPWWVDLALGLVIGQMVTSVGLVAHDTFHRAVFRSRFWQQVVGWVSWPWYLFGPGLWVAWHVQAHHGNTQEGPDDPDAMGTLADYRRSPLARLVHAVTPGSGTLLSYVSPAFLFTFQGQMFLWHHCVQHRKVTLNRTKERAISLAIIAGWLALAAGLGPWDALCLIAIPMLSSNATLMMYISTNHWLRPISRHGNNPFTNTTSVTVPWLLDKWHVEFSYHQEHHIFPQMSPKYGPLLREKLRELAPDAVSVYPLLAVWRELYRTPALYLDDHTLVRADGTGAIRLDEVEQRMRPASEPQPATA